MIAFSQHFVIIKGLSIKCLNFISRYVRIPSFVLFPACGSSLGMEDGRISSYRISSSSFLRESPHFRPDSARLNGAYAWCSQVCLLRSNNAGGEGLP